MVLLCLKFFVKLIYKERLKPVKSMLVKGDTSFICTIQCFSGDLKKMSMNSFILLFSLRGRD